MSWDKAKITDAGAALLNESLAGHVLKISGAVGGAGVVSEDELAASTSVADQTQTFSLLGIEDVDGGKRVGVQISNKDVTEKYILHQIGVTAHLDSDEDETLLLVFQDERGVEIPTVAEGGDFLFEVYAVIAISNKANITVAASSGAVISQAAMDAAINSAIQKHDADTSAHEDIRTELANIAAAAANTGGALISEITIPADGWEEVESDESASYWNDWRYKNAVSVSGATAEQYPDVTLHKDALYIAQRAQLCPTVQSGADTVTFWARYVPIADMEATLALVYSGGGTGGGSSYTLPVATATTLGGVKIGSGVNVAEDGTISVTAGSVSETALSTDDLATESDTSTMLNSVYPADESTT